MALRLQFSTVMSRLAGLLVLLLGSAALADTDPPAPPKTEEAPAKASKFPLRLVRVLADSEQALLFDKTKGRHVLVEVGDVVGDYTVNAISPEDGVTLAGKDMPVEVVLPAPERKWKRDRRANKELPADTIDAAPEDPYGAIPEGKPVAKAPKPHATDSAPADPYADEEVRAVSAVDGSEQPINATNWGELENEAPKKPAAPPHTDVWVGTGTKAKADAQNMPVVNPPDPPKAVTDVAAAGPTKITRKELNAALTDFGALAGAIDASFTTRGLELSKVQTGSIFAKAGLQTGDTITAVDGKPLKTIDDAADLYARAGSMKKASVQIVRAGKPQTLQISIQ